ncbi:hypothetical protein [Idiomarina aquatica]|uniref:Uncharacterized protein n=1 Tax=Idiomarina aquatica TaxID=1327752 RepID=A0AA94JEC0_9GAMM|nr:hypothetical protein [Idiomarina aquatica]RUO44985.1 hypothetical protein CWE23_02855 [Idiomarina aquatica]
MGQYLEHIRNLNLRSDDLQKTLDLLFERLCETKNQPQFSKVFNSTSITKNSSNGQSFSIEFLGLEILLSPSFTFNSENTPILRLKAIKRFSSNEIELGEFIAEKTFLADFCGREEGVGMQDIDLTEADAFSNTYERLSECISYLMYEAAR